MIGAALSGAGTILTAGHAWAEARALPPVAIIIGFGPAQGNDQPARPDAATLASNRMSPDMSYDQTARFLARRIGRFLPGSPPVRAAHAPGGAGLVAARRLADAPPDGSVIALLSSNVIYASALKLPGASVSADTFVWLGGVAPDAWACIRTRASVGKDTVWAGALGMGSRADVHARALRDIAGYRMEITSGYTSRFELVRALENGEVDVACGWPLTDLHRRRQEWLAPGKMFMIGVFSRSIQGRTAPEWLPDEAAREALEAIAMEAELAWPLAAPSGTSAQIVQSFSTALQALPYDRETIEDAQRAGITLDPIAAETIAERVRSLHTLSPETRAAVKKLYFP